MPFKLYVIYIKTRGINYHEVDRSKVMTMQRWMVNKREDRPTRSDVPSLVQWHVQCVNGITFWSNIHYILRGYENIEEKLKRLGAKIY